jgi:hypothetical protein
MIDQILFPDLDAGSLRWKHQQDRVSLNLKTPSSRWFGLYITAALGACRSDSDDVGMEGWFAFIIWTHWGQNSGLEGTIYLFEQSFEGVNMLILLYKIKDHQHFYIKLDPWRISRI